MSTDREFVLRFVECWPHLAPLGELALAGDPDSVRRLVRAVERLPRDREAYELRLAGLTYHEIGERLELPTGGNRRKHVINAARAAVRRYEHALRARLEAGS